MQELLIPTKIVKSKRRTLSLVINNAGDFIVRAPLSYKDSVIFDFINKKADWIIKKRTEMLANKIQPLEFKNGQTLRLLNKEYVILLSSIKSVKVRENTLILPINNTRIRLIAYLKRMLKKIVEEKINQINKIYGFKINRISISSAKTNWGSCSHNDKLHFTYRLALCPLDVIDYIIVHELCHTKVKNHSIRFWKLVKSIMPNYKTFERWLKDNKSIMNLL